MLIFPLAYHTLLAQLLPEVEALTQIVGVGWGCLTLPGDGSVTSRSNTAAAEVIPGPEVTRIHRLAQFPGFSLPMEPPVRVCGSFSPRLQSGK